MEQTERNESIAYEMALLVKENRELRQAVGEWERRYNELDYDFDSYRAQIERARERERQRKERQPKEVKLFDVPRDFKEGDKVVITQTSAKDPMFVKGFVIAIKSIAKNENGLVTIKGEHAYKYDTWKDEKMSNTLITNKFYEWQAVEAEQTSLIVKESWRSDKLTYERLVEV